MHTAWIEDMTRYYLICGFLDTRIKSEQPHSNDRPLKITWVDAFRSKYTLDINDFAREQGTSTDPCQFALVRSLEKDGILMSSFDPSCLCFSTVQRLFYTTLQRPMR